MLSKFNSEKYRDLASKVNKKVTDLNLYDSDDFTSPKEVDELWAKSEHFRDWLISLLARSGEIALETLENEGVFIVDDIKIKRPTCETTGLGEVDCRCPVSVERVLE